ncbi:MAG: KTSC domain-containing protein [Oxalobacteraceae bacterium]|nr:KTSC domain-containing protein [Oxalobacteraceae bacterium]
MIRIRSSAITAVGYDPTTQRMQIKFIEGHTYNFRVPSHIFEGFLDVYRRHRYKPQGLRHTADKRYSLYGGLNEKGPFSEVFAAAFHIPRPGNDSC